MKATGIVRRIDDLGRVVVPKEIRKTLRIKEGDPLEIFTAKDGEVILKKYSPMGEMTEFAQTYADSIGDIYGFGIIITDADSIIAVSKLSKKDYKDKSITSDLEDVMLGRASKYLEGEEVVSICRDDSKDYHSQYIVPIISESGDCIGSIIIIGKDASEQVQSEEKAIKLAAAFLGKQVQ
ncbi:MAG: AbrB/MazE/SpoVT family DNA-binding domain-containing protein [Clostridioides sp.]|nr:AbrB/MazE/SpoVT family DNA-binding domain-containing protein [Clostridioides sp.]